MAFQLSSTAHLGLRFADASFHSLGARSRCLANIADIKTSIIELRLLVKEIGGSRDAGYSVLGAALSAGLALEEVSASAAVSPSSKS